MTFTLLENNYDDGGSERVRRFFTKVMGWIQGAGTKSRAEWKRILMRDYSQYLVGGGSNTSQNDPLLESCQGCSGECSTCFIKKKDKGEDNMTLNEQFDEACGPYERPESEEEPSFDYIQQIIDGKLVQTPQSERDQRAYEHEIEARERRKKPKSLLTEAEIESAIQQAFGSGKKKGKTIVESGIKDQFNAAFS